MFISFRRFFRIPSRPSRAYLQYQGKCPVCLLPFGDFLESLVGPVGPIFNFKGSIRCVQKSHRSLEKQAADSPKLVRI